MKTLIEKVKESVMYMFLEVFWKETTIEIGRNEVIELGGFILVILGFLTSLFLLNCIGVINVF